MEKDIEALRAEYHEFVQNSKELEHEMEVELETAASKIKELEGSLAEEKLARQTLNKRLKESADVIEKQQAELQTLKESQTILIADVARLETENDDLHRSQREFEATNEMLQEQLDEALERCAMLEQAADDAAREATETEQGLRDELVNVRAELARSISRRSAGSAVESQQHAATDNEQATSRAHGSLSLIAALDSELPSAQDMATGRPPLAKRNAAPAPSAAGVQFNISPSTGAVSTATGLKGRRSTSPSDGGGGGEFGGARTAMGTVNEILERVHGLHERLVGCRTRVTLLLSPS